jgi:general secretion pathway protein K
LPPTPIANGSIEGRIEDAQGRLNVNNLAQDGPGGEAERMRFTQLFVSRGVPVSLLEAVADWIDEDAQRRPQGAEDAEYLDVSPTALAANAPLVRTAEFALVRGANARAFAGLAPDVAALPIGTLLNINTANADVLAAAIPSLAGEKLAEFVAERARKPFATMAELRERLPRDVTLPPNSTFAFGSSYFQVTVRSQQGDAVAQARALLHRNGSRWPAVVWQVLE